MCKRHLKPGKSVVLYNGLRDRGVHYNRGIIKSRDGEYYYITIMVGDEPVIVERYLTEIKDA